MDIVASSRQNRVNKKGNKENTQPSHGGKSITEGDKTTQMKLCEKQETWTKPVPLKAKTKQVDTTSSQTLNKVNTVQKDRKEAASTDVKTIASKPSSAAPPKSAPGMYKGKIVESKIGSIWKANASAPESQSTGNVAKSRSRSVSDVPRCGTQKPASRPPLTRPTATSCRPVRTVPLTVAPTKASGSQASKTYISVTDKVNKPPVTSKLSQYRLTMETAEQRRAKLAEWLASKGKTLKRPPSAPPKTKVLTKPKVEQDSRSHVQPQPATGNSPKTKQSVRANHPDSAATAHGADPEEIPLTAQSRTPEMLDNSDADVLMDDIVVNLCDVLEAMATPSRCNDDIEQETNNVQMMDNKPKDQSKIEEQNEIGEHFSAQVKTGPEAGLKQEMETLTPHTESASVVKYSVKTTPYLQSVKKTIEAERCSSKRKSNRSIKDLKFLTPVRRSCRIQRNSSHLPSMLVDRDPCVSSLAELVKLDNDPNAYIYRKNPALLEDLPDQF